MENIITVGQHHLAIGQVACVEPFDASAQREDFRSDKPYRSRIVLLNRDTHLSEDTPEAFVTRYGFLFLAEDETAFNPGLFYKVSSFTPTATFNPRKPFKTGVEWTDAFGEKQRKLLLTQPEIVLATLVRGGMSEPKTRTKRMMSRRRVERMQHARS
jgi:hypothetical protein